MFIALVILTLVVAAIDWWAAYSGNKPWEYVFKPATMVVLIAAALSIEDPVAGASSGSTIRAIMVLGLLLSLSGDVFLMLGEKWFLPGLVGFLLAHIAYIVALVMTEFSVFGIVIGAVVVSIGVAIVAPRIVSGANAEDPRMAGAVSVYLTVISFMVIAACGTGNPLAIIGAVLFYFSDACIGWDKFVQPLRYRSLLVMVTYHLGQIGLVAAMTI